MTTKPQITTKRKTIIELSCNETGRSLSLDKEVYDKAAEVVDHWLREGDVEFSLDGEVWHGSRYRTPLFGTKQYRIKQREPVAGEVWEVNIGTDCGDENYLPVVWLMDDGFLRAYFFTVSHVNSNNDLSITGADWHKRYIASSIKEFYCS